MSKSIINGKVQDDEANPASIRIQRCGEILRAQGYAFGNNNSNSFQANLVLNALGITVSRETKSFSLASAINLEEGIDNPHIVDPDIGGLTPEPVLPTDKFAEYSKEGVSAGIDSLYEQDEDLTEAQKRVLESLKKNDAQGKFYLAASLSHMTVETSRNRAINKYLTENKFRRDI
jgi:hypothetical protein